MKTIQYTITLLSDWHISSGLSSGAEADSLILKDDNGLPYIPGKTIKGLLRDAIDEIIAVQPEKGNKEVVLNTFGEKKEQDNLKENDFGTTAFFSNAVLSAEEKNELIANKLQPFLFRNITSTTIDDKGIAKAKSLRTIEVCMPITLRGEINDIEDEKLLSMAMKWTRRLGMKRNRGLGKCIFEITKTEN